MQESLDRIRASEEKAKQRVAGAKKRLQVELGAAQGKAEEARKASNRRAKAIIAKATDDAEHRAQARAREIQDTQVKEIEKLKSEVTRRWDSAIEYIVGEFRSWR